MWTETIVDASLIFQMRELSESLSCKGIKGSFRTVLRDNRNVGKHLLIVSALMNSLRPATFVEERSLI